MSTSTDRMANSADTDQTAPKGAVWSGSTLFAQSYLSEYSVYMVYTTNIHFFMVFFFFRNMKKKC